MSILQKTWENFNQANSYWKNRTQPIQGKSFEEKLQSLRGYYKLSDVEQNKLNEVLAENNGELFVTDKINDVNRYASHRTAFVANMLVQLFLVNLAVISLLGFITGFIPAYYFKIALVSANLLIVFLAWRRIRSTRKQLLQGPLKKPKWSFWGMFFGGNRRKHNKHIKSQTEPYRVRMRDERWFMLMYLINAVTIFFAAQLLFANYLPGFIQAIIGIPVFILSILFAVPNAYWVIASNNQMIKAATERGSRLDKMKI